MEKTKIDKLKEMMKAKKDAEQKKQAIDRDMPVADTPEEASGDEATGADEMTSQIKAAEDEAKAHYDKLLRVMAEFENFKKRIEREKSEHIKFSNQNLVSDLLTVMDDLNRVQEHLPKEMPESTKAIADGVAIVQNHLMAILAKYGLKAVETAPGDAFDPTKHEAVSHIPSKEYPEGTIISELRKGYQLHDRLIRPATVSVSKGES